MFKSLNDYINGDLKMIVDLYDLPLTSISACAEYGLCSKPTSYITYRVSEKKIGYNSWSSAIFMGDGYEVEFYSLHGKKVVPKFQAIYDFCYYIVDDSALQEVFDTLVYDDELVDFWEYCMNKGMSGEVKSYLEYLFLGGEYVTCPRELDTDVHYV